MDNQLKFRETLTVEQFKAAQHVDKIQVKQILRPTSCSSHLVQRLEQLQ
ncbi:hypothetical protein crAss001_1 [Bacteroides phage crAss001]|uniref:Uncharacterized protein n=1 Tax=Bacteroides phage crAss001 TaxID=2301731 RepID=A0A385DTA0_BPCA1|nr:hypothetical protein H3300_gp001 [Bacteroides phage crAss001]AXQ62644.1 hypothetical protein crAss001_1 [Bacteroides phage crAss001]